MTSVIAAFNSGSGARGKRARRGGGRSPLFVRNWAIGFPQSGAAEGGCMSVNERDAVFAALADEHRRLLLERLRRSNGQTLTRLCDGLPISRQAVTKHLLALEQAGLVLSQRRGRQKLHFLNPVPIHAIAMRWLRQFDSVKLEVLAPGEAG
jgi:DNA-binding transcriptional ArsR family regulator